MSRPNIKVKLQSFDHVVEAMGIIALIVLIALPFVYYSDLPDIIPSHFGASGKADGFSNKKFIWLLPILGTVMYYGMYRLNQYPHLFNFPQKVTEENAERLYTTASRMIRVLNVSIVCVFAIITHATIQTALEKQNGLGSWFIPVFLIFTFGMTFYFLYQTTKTSQSNSKKKTVGS